MTRTRATIRIWIGAPIAIAAVAALIAFDSGSGSAGGSRPVGPNIAGTHTVRFARSLETVRPHIVEVQALHRHGPGIVFDGNGDIVTNAHVLGGAKRATVTLSDGTKQQADSIGASLQHDLAVVRLAGRAPQPAAFAESSKVQVGDSALAIGNQLASAWSVTQVIGIPTSATASPNSRETLNSVILTSAAISSGDSGGVLVDLAGRVIGISALGAIDPQLGNAIANGIGFAIASDTVLRVADQLITSAIGGSRPLRPASYDRRRVSAVRRGRGSAQARSRPSRVAGGLSQRAGSSSAPQIAQPAANGVTRSPQLGQYPGPRRSI